MTNPGTVEAMRVKHICLVGDSRTAVQYTTLMVRSASSRVSNHEARLVASSFETRLAPLLRMRV